MGVIMTMSPMAPKRTISGRGATERRSGHAGQCMRLSGCRKRRADLATMWRLPRHPHPVSESATLSSAVSSSGLQPARPSPRPSSVPCSLRSVRTRNRIVVSPMCQYSAQDGFANDWHLVNAGKFAQGGAGIVFLEATAVLADGRITHGDLGLWNDDADSRPRADRRIRAGPGRSAGDPAGHAGPQELDGAALGRQRAADAGADRRRQRSLADRSRRAPSRSARAG